LRPAATKANISPAGRRVIETGAFLLPLVFWPGLTQPFSTPKLWLLAAVAAAILPFALKTAPHGREWPFLIWPVAVSISALAGSFVSFRALALAVLPVAICWAAMRLRLQPVRLARVLLYASAAESVIVVLQYCGADPAAVLGWRPEAFTSTRMRAYGTLGNPNYVAACLCATLPLFAGVFASAETRTRRPALVWSFALALQLAAIAATGSRVFLLAAPAAATVLLWHSRKAAKWWIAAVPVAAVLIWLSPARPLRTTVDGRLYLTQVSLNGWTDIPPTGYGPGSFAPRFAEWQINWLRQRGPLAPDRAFAGNADHAHNDYVEFLVEYGLIGFAAFVSACAWLVSQARRQTFDANPWSAAALAGVAALLAAAFVDFPFHRPAEWALFWILLAASAVGDNST
jgi:hypothetical protein